SNGYNGVSVATSAVATLIGISTPTNLYAATVLSNNPVAFWRLGEPDDGLNNGNPGVIAHDYAGGHNAAYNNANLGVPGDNPSEDSDTAALFGVFAASNSVAGEINLAGSGIGNINFATPVGGNAEYSVEAWVNPGATADQLINAGIVTKGYLHGEQFALDFG